jgi:hypothetical protein
VARAKRTARAEARRRYRADQGLPSLDETVDSTEAPVAPPPARPTAPGEGRLSIGESFRRSFRPFDWRGDLRSLPALLRTKAFLIPVALVLASTLAVIALGGTNLLSQFLYAYFVQTPAIGGVFLTGFLATRASWLLGAIVGFISAVSYALVIAVFPLNVYQVAPAPELRDQIIISGLGLSPLMGAFFAAAAAWYRRFLALSNPNRGRRPSQPQRRGNDGRTRSGQKAQARR